MMFRVGRVAGSNGGARNQRSNLISPKNRARKVVGNRAHRDCWPVFCVPSPDSTGRRDGALNRFTRHRPNGSRESRMKSTPFGDHAMSEIVKFANLDPSFRTSSVKSAGTLDNKPYVEHDPQIGYRYIANLNLTLPRPGGGKYHFQTNSLGLRSSREYAFKRRPGTMRIILCGDSMSGGQFVSNEQRMSEQLERGVGGLEVINLSLEGSGTAQQLLLYESVGLQYEH